MLALDVCLPGLPEPVPDGVLAMNAPRSCRNCTAGEDVALLMPDTEDDEQDEPPPTMDEVEEKGEYRSEYGLPGCFARNSSNLNSLSAVRLEALCIFDAVFLLTLLHPDMMLSSTSDNLLASVPSAELQHDSETDVPIPDVTGLETRETTREDGKSRARDFIGSELLLRRTSGMKGYRSLSMDAMKFAPDLEPTCGPVLCCEGQFFPLKLSTSDLPYLCVSDVKLAREVLGITSTPSTGTLHSPASRLHVSHIALELEDLTWWLCELGRLIAFRMSALGIAFAPDGSS